MKIKKLNKKKKLFLILILLILIMIIVYINRNTPEKNYAEPFVKIYLNESDSTIDLQIEAYIMGAVTAEMPLSFELEALKAQAVCARTYTVRKLLEEHRYPKNADLSDDINSCQAFISMENYQKKNPGYPPNLLNRVKEAVNATRGEIMLYKSQPIDALYYSCCGGRTASAEEGWGNAVPYLQSVKCQYCRDSKHFAEKYVFSNQILARSFNVQGKDLRLSIASRTSSGRAKEISINGNKINAHTFRSQLKLPSTWIDFESKNGQTVILTRGYGHGVGMCQYGSNGMAREGYDYHQILEKYYRGIDFYKIPY